MSTVRFILLLKSNSSRLISWRVHFVREFSIHFSCFYFFQSFRTIEDHLIFFISLRVRNKNSRLLFFFQIQILVVFVVVLSFNAHLEVEMIKNKYSEINELFDIRRPFLHCHLPRHHRQSSLECYRFRHRPNPLHFRLPFRYRILPHLRYPHRLLIRLRHQHPSPYLFFKLNY